MSKLFVQLFVGVLATLFLVSSLAAGAAAGAVRTPVLVGYQGDLADVTRAIRGHGGEIDITYRNFPLLAATVPAGAV
ncbi:MAG TPA: hypothetical protein VIL58_04320, partial [Thermoplasmata archaeon]